MAYQFTNATSVENLIEKIGAFAAAAGWTIRRDVLDGSNRTLTIQKSGDNINIFNLSNDLLRIRGAVGYDVVLAGNAQPNQAVTEARCNLGTGPFSNVFMFSGSDPADYVHVVVEIASGIFRMISFGEVAKFGAFTGGTYFDCNGVSGTSANLAMSAFSHRLFDNGYDFNIPTGSGSNPQLGRGGVRCDIDGETNYFAPFGPLTLFTTPVASGGMGNQQNSLTEPSNRVNHFYDRSVNGWAGVTPLQPVTIRIERAAPFWTNLGVIPGIRFMNMERFSPADEFSIGPDTWKVFPWVRKGSSNTNTDHYSQNYAFAFLKN